MALTENAECTEKGKKAEGAEKGKCRKANAGLSQNARTARKNTEYRNRAEGTEMIGSFLCLLFLGGGGICEPG